jgi:hypothetical protein
MIARSPSSRPPLSVPAVMPSSSSACSWGGSRAGHRSEPRWAAFGDESVAGRHCQGHQLLTSSALGLVDGIGDQIDSGLFGEAEISPGQRLFPGPHPVAHQQHGQIWPEPGAEVAEKGAQQRVPALQAGGLGGAGRGVGQVPGPLEVARVVADLVATVTGGEPCVHAVAITVAHRPVHARCVAGVSLSADPPAEVVVVEGGEDSYG